jgi:hypothetical protein
LRGVVKTNKTTTTKKETINITYNNIIMPGPNGNRGKKKNDPVMMENVSHSQSMIDEQR